MKVERHVFYSSLVFGLLVLVLSLFAIIKSISAISKYKSYEKYMEQHEVATEILKARKDLLEINKSSAQTKPLIALCLKSYTPPYEIYHLQSCKDKAINYLGYTDSYVTIKQLANTPLPKDVAKIIEVK